MKGIQVLAAILLAAAPVAAGTQPTVTGEYVEARTAEVFTGGCIMSSEAETIGRQAVMAWRIGRGTYDGVALDGLSVVAAVSGDRNLGIREIGGTGPALVRAAVIVDHNASAQQKLALVALVKAMAGQLIDEVVQVTAAPIRFSSSGHAVEVSAGDARLAVQRHVHHDPNCGAMQWFHPLATGTTTAIGLADVHAFSGSALGTRWSDPHKKSAFVGTFAY